MNMASQKMQRPPAMKLLDFVTQLLQTGSVELSPALEPFTDADLAATADLLGKYHRWDALSMPLTAPEFDRAAALWAASYLCRALQFVMVRSLGEELIPQHLPTFGRQIDAAAVYSADLTLRYLPGIYDLAKGLSPTDPLVENLVKTAQTWPFSTIGMPIEGELLTEHPSLQQAYADRVLAARDRKRAAQPGVNLQLQAALGAHVKQLWPDFEPIIPSNIDNARTIEH